MLLGEILARIPGIELRGSPDVSIRDVTHDSRRVGAGDLFVAIRGEKLDGAAFVPDAVRRGAAAVACEQPVAAGGAVFLRVPDARRFLAAAARWAHGDPSDRLRLAGITGTNGKTTTSYLVESVLGAAGHRSCLVGTLGARIAGRPLPGERTTPEASDLQRVLRDALAAGCTHGVMEVSSHALALARVLGTRLRVGVLTNVTPDHLDFHGDMESYYRAKRLLFLPEGENRVETAVVNADDPYGARAATEVPCPVVRFGFAPAAEIRPEAVESRRSGTELRLATPSGELRVATRLIGRPNVYNIMAAAGACLALGVERGAVERGLAGLTAVPGRMEIVDAGQPFTVAVDYAHTPDALEKALETLRELPHGALIVVFGCGGDRDRTKRAPMGRIAARMADLAIATSDNPRSEDPEAILAEIAAGLAGGPAEYRIVADRREAIRLALGRARPGDLVLLAGKGHETTQTVGGRVFPFDDREVAREILRARPPSPAGDPAEQVREPR